MTVRWILLALFAAALTPLGAEQPDHPKTTEWIARIDEATADPDRKMIVLEAMAQRLNTHRNRLLLLRRRTGESYGRIFLSQLEAAGKSRQKIAAELRAVDWEIERREREGRLAANGMEGGSSPPRPLLYVSARADHNSAGTFYAVIPEFGIDTRRLTLVAGVPFYRNSGTQPSAGGAGDVYLSGVLRGQAGRFDVGANLVVGLPTGDESRGLGAGKVTLDASALVQRRFEHFRPFLRAGVANYAFDNVGYQRPYISAGNAAHFSGGVDFQVHRRLIIGAGGFSLHPWGSQDVHSRLIAGNAGTGGGPMPGHGSGTPGMDMPGTAARTMPSYARAPQSVVSPDELRDYGPVVWSSVTLHPGITLNLSVARSFPYELTTIGICLGFDVGRVFFF